MEAGDSFVGKQATINLNQSSQSHLANIHGDRVGGKSLLPVRRRDGVDVLFQFKKRNPPLFERFLSLPMVVPSLSW
jgi:hypothetical protein